MGLSPVENLKGFATSRPPLMVFMVCLSAFAVILLSLAYLIKVGDVKDPDMGEDWNLFLQSFSQLQFCITGNATDPQQQLPTTPLQTKPTPYVATSDNYDSIRNYSVSLLMTIHPTLEFLRIPHNITHLYASVMGYQLGLKGSIAQEEMNVTFLLPYDWNQTYCNDLGKCAPVQIYTCVLFQASPAVFPLTRHPQMCQGLNETGISYHAHLEAHKDYSFFKYYRCQEQTKISVHHELDPTLTVMLSLHDRSVINLHLMHTSYFLFVMVVTLLCYALLKGRPSKSKYAQVQTEEQQI